VDTRKLDPNRPAPNFIVVGAAKAGTTSIHAYLARHPDVFMSKLKEPHYFSTFELAPEFENFMPLIRVADEYHELFSGSEGFKAVGEASPSYLCDEDAAGRIKVAIPDAKIIISLRDPVERAFSHYLMEFRQGRETRSFGEALAFDRARKVKGWGKSFQYLDLGLYADQVERYLAVFGSSRVHVLLFEELTTQTPLVMQGIAEFLGIEAARFPDATFDRAHNPFETSRGKLARQILRSHGIRTWAKRFVPRKFRTLVRDNLLFTAGRKPQLDGALRKSLAAEYAPDLERLERILDRDLSALKGSSQK